MTTQTATKHRALNLRAELRLALLAAAQACWIYAAALVIGVNAGAARIVTPLAIFFVYWIALQTGRLLPRSHRAWRVLQIAAIGIAVIAILFAIRVDLYENAAPADVFWLPNYFGRMLTFFENGSAEFISTLALVFAFLRGMSFAQRPLTLWLIGYEFRLGIVVMFVSAFFAALTYPANFIVWIFVYFGVSLPAIALARMEEAGQERALGGKWALVLLSVIAATMLLGFLLTRFFTLETIDALFTMLAPLSYVVGILIALLSVPVVLLLDLVAKLLTPFFDFARGFLLNLRPGLNGDNPEVTRVLSEVTRVVTDLMPYARLLIIILVIFFIGWLIARALNKRMNWVEQEMFVRETVQDRDGFAPQAQARAKNARKGRREIHAENVRRIYAAMLAQAEASGLSRRDAETPFEFLPRLKEKFPYVAPALDEITRAYVAVHYAQQPSTETQVRELRALWQTTQTQMRQAAKKV